MSRVPARNHRLALLTTTLACTAATVGLAGPAGAKSDWERGTYKGKSTQKAEGGGKSFKAPVAVALGILSDPPRLTRVELTARLHCDDGTTRDERYAKVIAFGPKLKPKGGFVYRDGGLVVRGKFGKQGKAHGSFSYTAEGCSVARATWNAVD